MSGVSRETVAGGTSAVVSVAGSVPAPADIEAALIAQAMPLPPAGPRGRLTWWTEARLRRLRELVLLGWSDEAIARDLQTPDWPLSPGTIRSRLSRLGWVVRRPTRSRCKR